MASASKCTILTRSLAHIFLCLRWCSWPPFCQLTRLPFKCHCVFHSAFVCEHTLESENSAFSSVNIFWIVLCFCSNSSCPFMPIPHFVIVTRLRFYTDTHTMLSETFFFFSFHFQSPLTNEFQSKMICRVTMAAVGRCNDSAYAAYLDAKKNLTSLASPIAKQFSRATHYVMPMVFAFKTKETT